MYGCGSQRLGSETMVCPAREASRGSYWQRGTYPSQRQQTLQSGTEAQSWAKHTLSGSMGHQGSRFWLRKALGTELSMSSRKWLGKRFGWFRRIQLEHMCGWCLEPKYVPWYLSPLNSVLLQSAHCHSSKRWQWGHDSVTHLSSFLSLWSRFDQHALWTVYHLLRSITKDPRCILHDGSSILCQFNRLSLSCLWGNPLL